MPAWEINSPAFISSVCLMADTVLETDRGGEMKIIHHTEALTATPTCLCLRFVSVHLFMCGCCVAEIPYGPLRCTHNTVEGKKNRV